MVLEKLKLVPHLPGCYLMKNKDGVIIYVGKAKNLQRRLRSYFTRTVTGKTKMLVEDIDDFESLKVNLDYINDIKMMEILKKNEKNKKIFYIISLVNNGKKLGFYDL